MCAEVCKTCFYVGREVDQKNGSFPYITTHISSENQITYRDMWSMVCTIYPTLAISSGPNNVQRNVENSLCYVPCFSPELCFMCNVLFTGCYVQYMCRGGVG